MLCAVCLAMFQNVLAAGRKPFQETFKDLVISATQGCWVCSIISSKLQQEFGLVIKDTSGKMDRVQLGWQSERPVLHEYTYYIFDADYLINTARIYASRSSDHAIEDLAQLHLIHETAKSPGAFELDGAYIPENPNTGGDEALGLAGRWLGLCIRDHECCSRDRDADWAPLRLLDLTGQTPRLLLREREKPKGPYVALSYCWGPNPTFLKLTAENLEQMCLQVPLDDLPLAFQHAMIITKRLGINYLWIDSLCILQSGEGSSEDWRRHLTEMRSVYYNCLVCIALAHAPDPSRGFFTSRDATLLKAPQISFNEANYTVVHANRFEERRRTPLANRAWVLQERMLSPRVLTFDNDQLFWDCSNVDNACETFPSGAPPYPKEKHSPLGSLPGPFSLPTSIHNDVEGYQLWSQIVVDYSQRSLTYPSKDKFVALSGIAEQMSQVLGDRYAAGFFTRTLPWSLMWRTSRYDQMSGRLLLAEPHRAPSWSWAKVDGGVYFSMRRNEDLAKRYSPGDFAILKDVRVALMDDSNQFGQIRSATLTLWGHTAFARPKSTPADESGMWDPDADPDVLWYIDGTPANTVIDMEDIVISMDAPVKAKEAARGFFLCPIVAKTAWGQSSPTGWEALILKRVQASHDKAQTHYVRVGVWEAPPEWLRLIKGKRVRAITIL